MLVIQATWSRAVQSWYTCSHIPLYVPESITSDAQSGHSTEIPGIYSTQLELGHRIQARDCATSRRLTRFKVSWVRSHLLYQEPLPFSVIRCCSIGPISNFISITWLVFPNGGA
jgi:hypothetical protein